MDYIEEIFEKHSHELIYNKHKYSHKGIHKGAMSIEEFREAVKDIEARHLEEVCKRQ